MPYVEHALGQTYYVTSGRKASGLTPIVCLHGGPGGTHKYIKALLDLSGDGRKVFIYDQLGSGRSTKTKKAKWDIETFVEQLDQLIHAWKLDEFILYGTSWGTTLALEFYLRKKGKGIKAIVFQSPFFSTKLWIRDANLLIKNMPPQTMKILQEDSPDTEPFKLALFEYYLKHVMRKRKKLEGAVLRKDGFNPDIYLHMWGPSEFRATGTLKTYENRLSLKRINVPTLFICGEFDEATPKTVAQFSKLVKEAKFKVLKNCSHSICLENPRLIVKTVNGFLKKLS